MYYHLMKRLHKGIKTQGGLAINILLKHTCAMVELVERQPLDALSLNLVLSWMFVFGFVLPRCYRLTTCTILSVTMMKLMH